VSRVDLHAIENPVPTQPSGVKSRRAPARAAVVGLRSPALAAPANDNPSRIPATHREAIRDELDSLRYLQSADSSALEAALDGASLIVATWSACEHMPERRGGEPAMVRGLGGDFRPCLAIFTDFDRFDRWRGKRAAVPWVLRSDLCWSLAQRLGCDGVAIDPGHETEYRLAASSVRRLIERTWRANARQP
jgi:hypothetical protein